MKHGCRGEGGWTSSYWDSCLEDTGGFTWLFVPPKTADHSRMHIVHAPAKKEVRMSFWTLDEEEALFEHHGLDED